MNVLGIEFEVIRDRYVLKQTPPDPRHIGEEQWLPWQLEHVYEGKDWTARFAVVTDGETYGYEVPIEISGTSSDGATRAVSC